MYYYIIDPTKLNQRQFERVQNQLYSCLSEYRISGETTRVTSLRTIPQLVDTALSHGAKTIVAVGTDETLHDVINALGDKDIVLGFVPLIETELGNTLGIRDIETACKIIASRRTANLDLGVANNYSFLTKLNFGFNINTVDASSWNVLKQLFNLPSFEVKFSANGQYNGSFEAVGGMILNSREEFSQNKLADPTDGMLDVLLLPKLNKLKVLKYRKEILSGQLEKIPGVAQLHVSKIQIESPPGLALRVGNKLVSKTPATIEVKSGYLKIIVGKDRLF